MSYALTALTVISTVATMTKARNEQKAQTQQLEMDKRANASAIEQAQADKTRETDMAVYQQERIARREESTARAGQANTGIAGITAGRQLDNVVFQSMLDENYIRTNGENALIGISNQGFNNASQIQSAINTSKRNTASVGSIVASSTVAGIQTYAAQGGKFGTKSESKSE